MPSLAPHDKGFGKLLFKIRCNTVVSEFCSRGFTWLRVLLLGALMPLDAYGLTLVYLGMEGLLAATASYPFVKDVLVRQDLRSSIYARYLILFLLIAAPSVVLMMYVGKVGFEVAIGILLAGFFNGFSQVALYVLRVADVGAHNRAKIIWALLTTFLFLGLLPVSWVWLPVVYFVGALTVFQAARRAVATSDISIAQDADIAHIVVGWLTYGTQALILALPQHGMRLFVAATMTLEDVARYTQAYMIATALFFVYSAIMIAVEAELSRASPSKQLGSRLPKAYIVSAIICTATFLYYCALVVLDKMELMEVLLDGSIFENRGLMALLTVFSALSGLRVVANSLVLAASGRFFSLIASIVGLLTLGIGLLNFAPSLGLMGLGMALTMGQAVELFLLIAFVFAMSRAPASRER